MIIHKICLSLHRRTSLKRLLSTQHLVRGSGITKVTKPLKEVWFRFAGICQRIVDAAKCNENSSKKCVHYIYTREASKKFPVCLPKRRFRLPASASDKGSKKAYKSVIAVEVFIKPILKALFRPHYRRAQHSPWLF